MFEKFLDDFFFFKPCLNYRKQNFTKTVTTLECGIWGNLSLSYQTKAWTLVFPLRWHFCFYTNGNQAYNRGVQTRNTSPRHPRPLKTSHRAYQLLSHSALLKQYRESRPAVQNFQEPTLRVQAKPCQRLSLAPHSFQKQHHLTVYLRASRLHSRRARNAKDRPKSQSNPGFGIPGRGGARVADSAARDWLSGLPAVAGDFGCLGSSRCSG